MSYAETICDIVSIQLRDIHNFTLKQETDGLVHTCWLNGSICELDGIRYFCYRTEQKPYFRNPRIHICQVDERFIPISEHFTLNVKTNELGWSIAFRNGDKDFNRAEDPRLFTHNGELYVFYTDGYKIGYGKINTVFNGEELVDAQLGENYWLKPPAIKMNDNYDGRMKNWSPFSKDGYIHALYCSSPVIFVKLDKGDIIETILPKYDIIQDLGWKWGFVKGGTPLYPWTNNRYITFFHSTQMYNGKRLYIVGTMTFDMDTLEPLQISRHPLIMPIINHDIGRIADNPNYILFPSGAIQNEVGFFISMGFNDYCNKLIFVNNNIIEYNLTYPVNILEKILDKSV